MSQWIGSVTANSINLVRAGGSGSGLLSLVGPLLLIAGVVTAVVAFSAQIEVVLTVLAVTVLVPGGKMSFKGSLTDLTDYALEAYVADLKRQMGDPLPDWLTALPTWAEACPPWRRYTIRPGETPRELQNPDEPGR